MAYSPDRGYGFYEGAEGNYNVTIDGRSGRKNSSHRQGRIQAVDAGGGENPARPDPVEGWSLPASPGLPVVKQAENQRKPFPAQASNESLIN